MKKIIDELFKCKRTLTDLEDALDVVAKHLDINIHRWEAGDKVWTWEIPKGGISIGEHTIVGVEHTTIILPIHLCHDKMANDNLSGVAVAIKLAQWLKNPRYTYKFLFLPETIGTMAYLSKFGTDYKYGITIDSVGGDGDLVTTLPKTPSLLPLYVSGRTNDFFSDAHLWSGNDERALESVGISSIQISRAPFLEYHSEKDTPDRISEVQLNMTLFYVCSLITKIEKDFVPKPTFKGVPCLSANGLWKKEYGSPHTFMKVERIWHLLDRNLSVAEIAYHSGNTFEFTYDFILALKGKGLVV